MSQNVIQVRKKVKISAKSLQEVHYALARLMITVSLNEHPIVQYL